MPAQRFALKAPPCAVAGDDTVVFAPKTGGKPALPPKSVRIGPPLNLAGQLGLHPGFSENDALCIIIRKRAAATPPRRQTLSFPPSADPRLVS